MGHYEFTARAVDILLLGALCGFVVGYFVERVKRWWRSI
jgi:hypothetical protein